MEYQNLKFRLTIVASYDLDEQGLIPKEVKESLESLTDLLDHQLFFRCDQLDKAEFESESPEDSLIPKGTATFTFYFKYKNLRQVNSVCKISEGSVGLIQGPLTISVVPELLYSKVGR